MENIIYDLAEYVLAETFERIPDKVIQKTKNNILYGLGIGLAGYKTDWAQIALNYAETKEPGIEASIIGRNRKSTLGGAVFANSVLMHSRTQEDTHGTAHPGVVVIPVSLAMAEVEKLNGRELLTAVVVGYEVSTTLSDKLTHYTTPRGFRASPIYGIFGAAAAAGKLLNLNKEQLKNAFALAANFACGLTECFRVGTMEWRFQPAMVARNGIIAAHLASAGVQGADSAIDGVTGFYYAFAGTREFKGVTEHLGVKYNLLDVYYKPFPLCGFNQIPAFLALKLKERNGLSWGDIEKVTLFMNAYEATCPGIDSAGPYKSLVNTQIGVQFGVALALIDNTIEWNRLHDFEDKNINHLAKKVDVVADEERSPLTAKMIIQTKDGKYFEDAIEDYKQYLILGLDEIKRKLKQLSDSMEITDNQLDKLIANCMVMENITINEFLRY